MENQDSNPDLSDSSPALHLGGNVAVYEENKSSVIYYKVPQKLRKEVCLLNGGHRSPSKEEVKMRTLKDKEFQQLEKSVSS